MGANYTGVPRYIEKLTIPSDTDRDFAAVTFKALRDVADGSAMHRRNLVAKTSAALASDVTDYVDGVWTELLHVDLPDGPGVLVAMAFDEVHMPVADGDLAVMTIRLRSANTFAAAGLAYGFASFVLDEGVIYTLQLPLVIKAPFGGTKLFLEYKMDILNGAQNLTIYGGTTRLDILGATA